MKRLLLVGIFLYLSTSLLTAPVQNVSRGDIVDEWMTELYPEWWEWTDKERQVIRSMFDESTDKHAWFPEHFDRPAKKSFRIEPANRRLKL